MLQSQQQSLRVCNLKVSTGAFLKDKLKELHGEEHFSRTPQLALSD